MAKTLVGQFGSTQSAAVLARDNARLRARVAELDARVTALAAQLADAAQENDRLSALHAADLDTELQELAGA